MVQFLILLLILWIKKMLVKRDGSESLLTIRDVLKIVKACKMDVSEFEIELLFTHYPPAYVDSAGHSYFRFSVGKSIDLSKSVCSFVAKRVNSYRLSVGDDELIQF